MRIRAALKIIAASCLLISSMGFYSNKKSDHDDLGLHRAKVDDRGLVEFAVDRVWQSLRQGDVEALEAVMTPDFVERNFDADGHTTSILQNFNKNDIFESISSHLLPKIKLRTSRISLKDELAIVSGHIVSANTDSKTEIELTFRKINKQWKLTQSKGLFGQIAATASPAGENGDSDFYQIFAEKRNDANRTLIRRDLHEGHRISKLTRAVTRDKLDRQLFSKPYSSVLFSSVTQLESAPFFAARYVQLVTDPAWNRIVYGDYEGWIKTYSGTDSQKLNRPHGIDRDVNGRIYVADTGNNRIVVLQITGNGESTRLEYEFDFGAGQLNLPYDVAWDDAGTPFVSADDIIWVADTGNNRILGFSPGDESAVLRYTYGSAGKSAGSFHGPKAVAVGRFNGVSDGCLYVADTGNRRIARLVIAEDGLKWSKAYSSKEESQFTSVDVDHWGNVYATDRSYREILKLSSDLQPIVTIRGEGDAIVDPVSFRVVFGRVFVAAENRNYWAGYDQAMTLEKWSEQSGAERFQLGVDLQSFNVSLSHDLDRMVVNSTLTDHGNVTLSIIDDRTDVTVRQMPLGWMIPGDKEFVWQRRDDLGWQVEPGYYRLQLSAESSYGAATVIKETPEFYLPLYYHEDSGSDTYRDAHLVQGVRSAEWGDAPSQTIAHHPSEVIYRFTDLNPSVDYEIKAEFLNEAGYYLKQSIIVDDTRVLDGLDVPVGRKSVDWFELPRATYSDGEISVRIRKIAGDGDALISQLWLREANFDPASPPVLHDGGSQAPEAFSLAQNYPNPFNPTTTIQFAVPADFNDKVTLKVFNMLGQTVKVLVNEQLPPGRHSVVWNGRDKFEKPASSGVYVYQLNAGDFVEVRKLILMK